MVLSLLSRHPDASFTLSEICQRLDLNVSTARGAAALYSRIHDAAVDVCSRMYYTNASYVRHSDACLQQLIADAVLKVNEPALSAVFASRYGVAAPVRLAAAEAR